MLGCSIVRVIHCLVINCRVIKCHQTEVVFTGGGRHNKEIATRITKENAVLR